MRDLKLSERSSAAWLSLGIVLTTATKLRPTDLPVGPGEVILAGWALVTLPQYFRAWRAEPHPAALALFAFWLLAVPLLLMGWAVSYVQGVDTAKAWHTAGAFAFVAGTITLFASLPGLERRILAVARILPVIAVVPLIGLVILGLFDPMTGGWSVGGTNRFFGWSENPNSIAFLLVLVPMYVLVGLRERSAPWRRVVSGAMLLGTLVVGFATKSEALLVGWGLACAVLIGAAVWRFLPRSTHAHTAAVAIGLLGLAAMGALVLPELASADEGFLGRVNQDGQIETRLALWRHALSASATSPLVGLGPGSFSGLTGPFQGYEAHNIFLDWGMSTGLLGLALLAAFLGWVGREAWRSGDMVLVAAFAALLGLGMFHYFLRHPVVWLGLVAIAVLARQGQRAAAAGEVA